VEVQSGSGLPHLHTVAWQPLAHTTAALLNTLQHPSGSNLTRAELEPLVQIGGAALTVATCPLRIMEQFPALTMQQAAKAANLALGLQRHACTAKCAAKAPPGQTCNKFFPRLPTLLNLMAVRPDHYMMEAQERLAAISAIHQQLQVLLRQDGPAPAPGSQVEPAVVLVALLQQLGPAPLHLPGGGYSWEGVTFLPGQQLDGMLQECGALAGSPGDTCLLAIYHLSLLTRYHSKYRPVRRVCEVWVAGYNPWVLLATEANMELDLVTHSPAALEEYLAKGPDQDSLKAAIAELEGRGGPGERQAAKRLKREVRAGRREVTLTEAFFRLDSRLHLTEQSPTSVEWVPVGLGEAGRVAHSQAKQHYSLRPGDWEHLTLCQMMMWYRGEKPGEEAANAQQGPAVPLVMAAHLALPAISFLPPVLLLEGGTRLRRLRKPRAVDWTPRTEYGQLVMFRVSKQINMVTVIDGETLCLY
jgi:hypothetical protein